MHVQDTKKHHHFSSDRLAWLAPPLLFSVLYVVLASIGALYFHINDDLAEISIVSNGDFHTLSVHFILGWILMNLYSWKANFFWYDLLIIIGYSAAIFRIFFISRRYNFSYYSIILLMSCILLGFIPFQPHNSLLAMLLAVSAVLPLIMDDDSGFKVWPNGFISFLFLFWACLYRSSAALLVVVCSFGIVISLAACELIYLCDGKILKNILYRSTLLLGMILFSFFMSSIHRYSFLTDPEYARFLEYNKYRSAIKDYQKYRHDSSWQKIGLSQNDFNMINSFMAIDSPPFHLENLKLLQPVSISDFRRIHSGVRKIFASLRHPFSLLLFVLALCLSLVSRQIRVIFISCLTFLCLLTLYFSRARDRIYLPILSLAAITAVFYFNSWIKSSNFKLNARYAILITFFSLFVVSYVAASHYSYIEMQSQSLESQMLIWNFCKINNINSLVVWPESLPPGKNCRMFDSFNSWKNMHIDANSIGGWDSSFPKNLLKFRTRYGQDIYLGISESEIYHVVPRTKQHTFETFLAERGSKAVTFNILYETKDSVLYLIR